MNKQLEVYEMFQGRIKIRCRKSMLAIKIHESTEVIPEGIIIDVYQDGEIKDTFTIWYKDYPKR